MTLTSVLNDQQSSLDLLASLIELNKLYVTSLGYPSGKNCPHCGKPAFASISTLEALAAAPAGSQLAHDYCLEIAALKAKVAELEKGQPKITLVQLPNPTAQEPGDGGEQKPAEPAPSDPAEPADQTKEESRVSA